MRSVAANFLKLLFCLLAVAATPKGASATPFAATSDASDGGYSSGNQSAEDTSLWSLLNPWSTESSSDSASLCLGFRSSHNSNSGSWAESRPAAASAAHRLDEGRRLSLDPLNMSHLFCETPQSAGAGAPTTSTLTYVSPVIISERVECARQQHFGCVGRENKMFRPMPFLDEIFHPPRDRA